MTIKDLFANLQAFQLPRFAVRTMAYGYSRTKKKLPVNTVSDLKCQNA